MRLFKKKKKEIEVVEISSTQREEYKDYVIAKIKSHLDRSNITDLGDIGNEIGIAVGSIVCKDGKDLNLWSFQKDDFLHGFEHGYSLMDDTH
jgi:hypothetical protein